MAFRISSPTHLTQNVTCTPAPPPVPGKGLWSGVGPESGRPWGPACAASFSPEQAAVNSRGLSQTTAELETRKPCRKHLRPPSTAFLLLTVLFCLSSHVGTSAGLSPWQLGPRQPGDFECVALFCLERLNFTAGSPFSRPGCSRGAQGSPLPWSGPRR